MAENMTQTGVEIECPVCGETVGVEYGEGWHRCSCGKVGTDGCHYDVKYDLSVTVEPGGEITVFDGKGLTNG